MWRKEPRLVYPGSRLISVNGQPVRTLTRFRELLQLSGDRVTLGFSPDLTDQAAEYRNTGAPVTLTREQLRTEEKRIGRRQHLCSTPGVADWLESTHTVVQARSVLVRGVAATLVAAAPMSYHTCDMCQGPMTPNDFSPSCSLVCYNMKTHRASYPLSLSSKKKANQG